MGYTYTEMCYPVDYASIGYGFMKDMTPAEIKKTIEDAGLTCISSHFGMGGLAPDKIDASIEWAKKMSLTQMICSTFWLPKTATLKDENVCFFQIGLFRETSEVPETIIIDRVIEATMLEDVTPPK